jgi:hypothetical protein
MPTCRKETGSRQCFLRRHMPSTIL